MTPIEDSIALLKILWPDEAKGFGEIRILKEGEALRPLYLPIPLKMKHLQPALEWAHNRNTEGYNVYIGVHNRTIARGNNESVKEFRCFIADLDNTELSWPRVQAFADAGFPASICVRTCRGVHLYWLLETPEFVTTETRSRMQLLQRALFSDRVHDPARVLRLPGSVGYGASGKFQIYTAWLNASIRYNSKILADKILKLWPDTKIDEVQNQTFGTNLALPSLPVSNDIWNLYCQPAEKGTRSELCFGFIQQTVLHGWPDEAIFNALQDIPIGGHYLERGNPLSAFKYDLDKAKARIHKSYYGATPAEIVEASIYENPPENNLPGTRKLKVRYRFENNATFLDWILIPDQHRPSYGRWASFLNAVNLTLAHANPTENLLMLLPGRRLKLEFSDDAINKVGSYFSLNLPEQNKQKYTD